LFDPNFDKYIDIDYKIGNFVIKRTDTENVIVTIPRGMLDLNIGARSKSKSAIQKMGSHMMFFSDTIIRVISPEGFDTLLKIGENKADQLQIVSQCRLDNFNPKEFVHDHALMQ
jgi:hypothetical protein